MKYWAYIDGRVRGPYDAEQLRSFSWFGRDTLVCPTDKDNPSENDWKPAKLFPELCQALGIHPMKPPPPPAPELLVNSKDISAKRNNNVLKEMEGEYMSYNHKKETKKCLSCLKQIHPDAKKCKHCGKSFEALQEQTSQSVKKSQKVSVTTLALGTVLLSLLIAYLVVTYFPSLPPSLPPEKKVSQEEEKISAEKKADDEWLRFRNNPEASKGEVVSWKLKLKQHRESSGVIDFAWADCWLNDNYKRPVEVDKYWTEANWQAWKNAGSIPEGDWIAVTGKFDSVTKGGEIKLMPIRIERLGYSD